MSESKKGPAASLEMEPRAAYDLWAPLYSGNPLKRAEERLVLGLLEQDLTALKILDAGCGNARYWPELSRRNPQALLGIDLSLGMLHSARNNRPSARLVQGDISRLPLAGPWAHRILSCLALGHLPDLTIALTELRRVVLPDGKLFFSEVHSIFAERGWARDFRDQTGRRIAVRSRFYRKADWIAAGKEAGWDLQHWVEAPLTAEDFPADESPPPTMFEQPVLVAGIFQPLHGKSNETGPISTSRKALG